MQIYSLLVIPVLRLVDKSDFAFEQGLKSNLVHAERCFAFNSILVAFTAHTPVVPQSQVSLEYHRCRLMTEMPASTCLQKKSLANFGRYSHALCFRHVVI